MSREWNIEYRPRIWRDVSTYAKQKRLETFGDWFRPTCVRASDNSWNERQPVRFECCVEWVRQYNEPELRSLMKRIRCINVKTGEVISGEEMAGWTVVVQ